MICRVKMTAVLLLFAAVWTVHAQIGIAMSLNRRVYMQYENIFACVTLRNDTGKPLLFGKDPALQGFVLFDVRDEADRPVAQKDSDGVSVTGLMLGPGEVRKLVIPLNKYYKLNNSGRYKIHAFVSHNALKHEYRSKDIFFRINPGIEVWKKEVGLPEMDEKKGGKSGMRKYSIRVVAEDSISSYYLMVEDEKKIFAVTKIGQVIGYERYSAEVDMLSRIHLLMPISPRVFHYLAFNADGVLLVNSYWKNSDSIPMLFRDSKSGKVTRIGGVPARAGVDFRDPKRGMLSVSELLEEDRRVAPKAVNDAGLVDLGKNVLPEVSDDENRHPGK